ncbi:hypothetical protein T552_01930 [Pneumocystis carinii B80]|uniref:Uncharacterized protein n=1 Tax=Pneumocystis carinii (strain B80) TaxID=1408658 RepID=A0A0W4ZI94_PNEC8|nr:hypothetical protein T552_01930 [Pneumocystis carinii B80]KTW28068.1 hypothetical protein T552_01930 [Pneumocystis carinii B80]
MKKFNIETCLFAKNNISFFDIKFFPQKTAKNEDIFAIVGNKRIIIAKTNGNKISVLSTYHDLNKEENLCCCAWTIENDTNKPLLCVAGASSVIKIIDIYSGKVLKVLKGHGDEILDIKVSPVNSSIIATASFDHTIRIWSLMEENTSQPTLVSCGGEGGHDDRVLTIAFHRSAQYILSGGMDHSIKIWTVPTFLKANKAEKYYKIQDNMIFLPYPHFSTTAIHTNYVDCVEFYGDLIFSKSAEEGKIILWKIHGFDSKADPPRPDCAPTTYEWSETRSFFGSGLQKLLQFMILDCNPWFMRFTVWNSLDTDNNFQTLLTIGNFKAKIFIWEISENIDYKDPYTLIKPHIVLTIPKTSTAIRQLSINNDGSYLIAVGDMGLIALFKAQL